MLITRRVEFSASHRCADPALPGDTRDCHGHGHNFLLEVTLDGEPDPITGMVFDLKQLKEIISRAVVEPMDHRFLNLEVPPFDHVIPTPENIAVEIWRRLAPHFDTGAARLHSVRLYETGDLYVEYWGERT